MAADSPETPDPAANRRWPLTTLMGNGPRIRILQVLIEIAPRPIAVAPLCERADVTPDEVEESLEKLMRFGMVETAKFGLIKLRVDSGAVKPLSDLEALLHAYHHPDSWAAEFVTDEHGPVPFVGDGDDE